MSQITTLTPTSHKKPPPFVSKGRMEELLDCCFDTLQIRKLTPNSWRKVLHTAYVNWQSQKRWSRSSTAFQQSMQQKSLTSEVLLLTSQPTKQNLPDKEPIFFRNLVLWTTSKTNSLGGVWSNNRLNKGLQVYPRLGLGF